MATPLLKAPKVPTTLASEGVQTAKISIIIPVYNNPEGLLQTLRSLERLEDNQFEVIVVDDASSRSYGAIRDGRPVRLVRLSKNSGPGFARNEGVKIASGEILAFTDSDCTVPPDWLSKIREAFQDPAVVAVAGGYSGEHVTRLTQRARFLESSYYHLKERAFVSSFITANFAIRRKVFEEVGCFPNTYYCEDLILGIRLSEKGYEVLWLPTLWVGQYFRPTFLSYFKQQFHWGAHVALTSATYPKTQSLNWCVHRKLLLPQLVLTTLLPFSPFVLKGPLLSSFVVLACFTLFGANLPFLAYVARRRSLKTAIGMLGVVVFGRNLAWSAGCLFMLLSRPKIMFSGMVKILRHKLTARPAKVSSSVLKSSV